MHVKFAGVKLTLAIPLKDFLCTGIMRKHARTDVLESGVKRQLELNAGDNWLLTVFLRVLLRPWG